MHDLVKHKDKVETKGMVLRYRPDFFVTSWLQTSNQPPKVALEQPPKPVGLYIAFFWFS